jgi:hypothetical protein
MNGARKPPLLLRWTGRLAIVALLALPVAVIMVRAGLWRQGLLLYALACLGGALLLAWCAVLLCLPRSASWRGALLRAAALALPGALLLLLLLARRGDYPPIHDVTTDPGNPPLFTRAAVVRGSGANSLALAPEVLRLQREAYPELRPLLTRRPPDEAFDRALQVARDLGWEIYHQDRRAGTTPIMGFKDDVVIRVRGDEGGARLDLRSVSRVGIGDLGANARRISLFTDRYGP